MQARSDRSVGALIVKRLSNGHDRFVGRRLDDCSQVKTGMIIVSDEVLETWNRGQIAKRFSLDDCPTHQVMLSQLHARDGSV